MVEDIGNLMHGFAVALTWKNLLFMLVGILLGVLIGVLPGLGGANGVAILLPLTFTMSPTSAIIMLSCIYWGRCLAARSRRSCSTYRVAMVGGDHVRWLSMAQQGRAGRHDRRVHVVVRRRTVRDDPDRSWRRWWRNSRSSSAPEFFAVQFFTFCSFVGMGREPQPGRSFR